MPWIPDIVYTFAARITVAEAAVLLGLLAVMAAGLSLPWMKQRSRRAFEERDDEFRRLQSL